MFPHFFHKIPPVNVLQFASFLIRSNINISRELYYWIKKVRTFCCPYFTICKKKFFIQKKYYLFHSQNGLFIVIIIIFDFYIIVHHILRWFKRIFKATADMLFRHWKYILNHSSFIQSFSHLHIFY